MTPRENLLHLWRRQGCEYAPADFVLCPDLEQQFQKHYPQETDYQNFFQFPGRGVGWPTGIKERDFSRYYDPPLAPGAWLDSFGVGFEAGGPAAKHMRLMRHPMEGMDSLEQMQTYPWPEFEKADWSGVGPRSKQIQQNGQASFGSGTGIWEQAWYLRGMDLLMLDMAAEDEKAAFLLDQVAEQTCGLAKQFALAGVDILQLGDDVGMQSTTMMSQDMYRTWLKPRLKRVIDTARSIKPDIIIRYHSCGYIWPLIDDLIEAGIDVLNPVQPECMDFETVFQKYKGRLSFEGTLGTQTTMPFGSPDDVKATVHRNLKLAGVQGGLLCSPTHMLEPEVPWANIEAYVEAVRDFRF